jgi:putative ABC transport system permease protein
MVTAEIALALFLLVGTGLLFRGIFLVEHQNLGFRTDHLLTAGVTLDSTNYEDASQRLRFVQDLLTRLQQLPSADSVAVSSDLPSSGPGSVTLRIKGRPELPSEQRLSARDLVVSAAFFDTAGIPLQRGRTFRENDNAEAPRVVVVNQEFVRRNLQGQEPLGKEIHLDVSGGTKEWSEIVGVVSNVKAYSEETREEPEVYESFLQRPVPSFSIMMHATFDPSALASGLRTSVAQMDAELPLERVMSMTAVIEHQREGNPFFVNVMGSFALLALILASIGIYGLVAYSVSQRTHEIGIRMALGAKSPDVLRMVLWEGLKMTAIGGAIGLALALPLPKIFDAIFYGLHIREPWLYLVVPAAVLMVAMLATYVPARRAARVDPMRALRQE